MSSPRRHSALYSLVCIALVALFAAGCNTTPDKRALQYLNTDGFGNRYTGNAEEENWVAIGDSIQITDSYEASLEGKDDVDIDGTVLLPEIGVVRVAGLTRSEIEALLTEKYAAYYDKLDIKVRIITRNKFYYIFGEVTNQGEQPFEGDLTLFQAVMRAVPNPESSNLGRVRLIRADPKDPLILYFDIGDIFERGDATFNVHVQESDIVYVPPTMLASFGYFLDALLFPVKQVLSGLGEAIFSFERLSGRGYYGGRGGNQGGIF